MKSRILVIDDSEDMLDLYRDLLQDEGYEVELSATLPDNLSEIEHLHPDLIILDFMIDRHQNGLKHLQKMKMYRPTASIPILLCSTTLNEAREQEEYVHQQGIPVVGKPFEIDDFLDAVRLMFSSKFHNLV